MLRRLLLACLFVFAAAPAFAADNVLIIVDLQMQTMHVRVDGVTRHRWDISSGREGFDTPPGRYQPTRMYRTYHSRQYDMAPMPYSIFFHQGYAIHGTTYLDRLGRTASHGCVRLATENAEALFALVKQAGEANTVIRVESQRSAVALVRTAPLPRPRPVEPLVEDLPVVAQADGEAVDPLTTGSTEPPVDLLRPGHES